MLPPQIKLFTNETVKQLISSSYSSLTHLTNGDMFTQGIPRDCWFQKNTGNPILDKTDNSI